MKTSQAKYSRSYLSELLFDKSINQQDFDRLITESIPPITIGSFFELDKAFVHQPKAIGRVYRVTNIDDRIHGQWIALDDADKADRYSTCSVKPLEIYQVWTKHDVIPSFSKRFEIKMKKSKRPKLTHSLEYLVN